MYRVIASFTLLLVFACSASAQRTSTPPKLKPPSAAFQLSPDVTVRLVTLDRIKSGTSRKGDRVDLRVDEDVVDPAGVVLIRKGTPAYGTVEVSKGAKGFGKSGKLEITIDHTTAVDGQQVRLRASDKRSGKGKGGTAAAVSVLVFLPAAFWIKGKNAELPPLTEIIAYVDETVQVGGIRPATLPTAMTSAPTTVPLGNRVVLVLTNGDRITGALKNLANGVYVLFTRNQTLRIKATDVERVQDADP